MRFRLPLSSFSFPCHFYVWYSFWITLLRALPYNNSRAHPLLQALILLSVVILDSTMGVVVLHPQDCLRSPLKNQYPGTPRPLKKHNPHPNPNQNKNRRRRSPEKSQKVSLPPHPVKNFVIGQVKILRCGEPYSKPVPISRSGASGLRTTDRLSPEPDVIRSQVRVHRAGGPDQSVSGFYAGSVVTSPPPSSVPLPGFFTRKSLDNQDDDATSGLRRLLGLN